MLIISQDLIATFASITKHIFFLACTMVKLEFEYFHTFDLDRPIAVATSPVATFLKAHSIFCRVRVLCNN